MTAAKKAATKPKGKSRQKNNNLQRVAASGNAVRAGKMPQRLTIDAWNRIHEELNYDPLAEAVKIAKGEALTQDHPFLAYLEDAIAGLIKKLAVGQKITESELAVILDTGRKLLTDSWTSHDLRSKAVFELLGYIYAKRKHVETSHTGSVGLDLQIRPLLKDEVEIFEQKFDKDF